MVGKRWSWFPTFLQSDFYTVGVGCRLSPSLVLRYDFTSFHYKCVISSFGFTSNAPVIEADYLVHCASSLLIRLTGVAAGEKILICIRLLSDRPFPRLFTLLLSHLQVADRQQQHLWPIKPSYLPTALMGTSFSTRLNGRLYVGQR